MKVYIVSSTTALGNRCLEAFTSAVAQRKRFTELKRMKANPMLLMREFPISSKGIIDVFEFIINSSYLSDDELLNESPDQEG